METEKLTDKEVYQKVKAKEKFKKYFSAGHAVDTYRIAITHTNESSEVSSQGSQFGGRGRKRFEHGGSDRRSKKAPKFHLLKPKQHQVVKFTFHGFSIFIEYKPTANCEENLHICTLKSKNIIKKMAVIFQLV